MIFLGYRGNVDGNHPFGAQYPEIRGTGYVEPQPVNVGPGGPPQTRIFRNAAEAPVNAPYVPPSYPAGHYDHHDHGYSFQTINGQYVNTGKRRKRDLEDGEDDKGSSPVEEDKEEKEN